MPKVSAKDVAAAVFGRRSSPGVEVTAPSGPDQAREITISAEAANQLLGVGTGGTSADQTRVRRFRPQISGLEIIRFNGVTAERERRGLSVEQLATASGLPVALVERMEGADEVPEALQQQFVVGLDSTLDRVFPVSSTAGGKVIDQTTVTPLRKPTREEVAAATERERDRTLARLEAARDQKQVEAAEHRLRSIARTLALHELRDEAAEVEARLAAL